MTDKRMDKIEFSVSVNSTLFLWRHYDDNGSLYALEPALSEIQTRYTSKGKNVYRPHLPCSMGLVN